jgi:serine/threonine protein phosphatase PrpC
MMNIHVVSLKGKRDQNEDKHNIILNIDGKDNSIRDVNFFGLYDGHGGKFVSKFLSEKLPNFFLSKKQAQYPLQKKYITDVYKFIQKKFREKYLKETRFCGATCLVVINYKKDGNDYLNVLNTGDCRAVICEDNLAKALTKDHKPNWPEEKSRIEALGGKLVFDGVDWRIKDLSVSRAFGDLEAEPYVTNEPEIVKHKVEKNNKFLIMACDGLWDVMSSQDAVNFVLSECYDKTTKVRINKNTNISSKLARHAIAKLGSTDNVSVVVVFF